MSLVYRCLTMPDAEAIATELRADRPRWAVHHVRPHTRDHGQRTWSDLLQSLGHRAGRSLQGRAGSHSESLAYAWLATSGIDHIVLSGAQNMNAAAVTKLTATIASLGIDVWLLYDVGVRDERAEAEHNLLATEVDAATFLDDRRRAGERPRDEQRHAFPAVPAIHFLGFLSSCRELLSRADADLACDRYRAGRTSMVGAIRTMKVEEVAINEHTLGPTLHQFTAGITDVNEIAAYLRGAEAGAFREGFLLKVDDRRWLQRGKYTALSQHLEPRAWNKISQHERPVDAAVCTLAAIGIPVNDMQDLAAADVALDGSSVSWRAGSIAVPEPGRLILMSQHVHRILANPTDERFLAQVSKEPELNARRAGDIVAVFARDTGIALRASNTSRESANTHSWRHRLGLSVEAVAA